MSAPAWIIGLSGVVIAAGMPAGARLASRRPSLSRLLIVNAFVVLALWTATWHYVLHSRPATVTSVVIGLVAGVVWGAEHVATFKQSAQWADQLSENIGQLEWPTRSCAPCSTTCPRRSWC